VFTGVFFYHIMCVMEEQLKTLIKEHWDIDFETIDTSIRLITLAENIAMADMGVSREETYSMFIDNPDLHLPGLVALYIIDELGIDAEKVNATMPLDHIFTLLN
jgi:hypothetical protein